jgi:hypothetical protein
MMTTHVVTIVIQNNSSYIKWTLENDFIPLAIETYGYFHPRFDPFWLLVYMLVELPINFLGTFDAFILV